MKNRLFIIVSTIALTIFSCKAVKKAEHVQKQIEKKDTSKIVLVSPASQSDELDSLHQTLEELDSQKIRHFNTFAAKAKIDYNSNGNSQNVTANIHIKEDSAIWISITALLGIEAFRIMIKPDSMIFMNKLNHTVARKGISYLQEILKVPLSFNDLQNILLGNPIFTKGDVSSYKHPHNRWFISIDAKEFTNLITLVDNNRKLILKHSRLQDSTADNNRVCDMTFSAHQQVNDNWFSQARTIDVSDNKTLLQLKLQFKEFSFGNPVTFPFSIPSNYDEK
ncbi:MAG TPA: DUF4292 domain-containing protein [Arachidicoccus sp.]